MMNRSGFTFLSVIFIIMIMGVMLGMTGQSWKMIMKREREKELLFRGSQIKEAIENWYNPNYSVGGIRRQRVLPLMDLKDLLEDTNSLQKIKFLPQHYGTKLDTKDKKCGSECASLFVYQDPLTGKEWTLIRGTLSAGQPVLAATGVQNAGIIGVASKSEDEPIRKDFKDTALEKLGTPGPEVPGGAVPTVSMPTGFGTDQKPPGSSVTKYSEWKFIADPANDHKKMYRAYREGW